MAELLPDNVQYIGIYGYDNKPSDKGQIIW